MKKLLLIACCTLSVGAWAENLQTPKNSCQITDLQSSYARLFAAGHLCGVDEKSFYAKSVSKLFINDQKNCKVSSAQIDPQELQIDQAINEIESLSLQDQRELCKTLDDQIRKTLRQSNLH